jgi:hypothetical protein
LTIDLTGGDIDSVETTKILISDIYRTEVKFYPSIVIKSGGGSYKPISFNQEGTLKYRIDYFENEDGTISKQHTPTHRVYAGAWETNLDVSIFSESHSELEEIVEITAMILQGPSWHELRSNGLVIKNITISSENAEPYANDYVYNQTISLPLYSEWRIEIPIENVIEKILFYFDSVRTPLPPNGQPQ